MNNLKTLDNKDLMDINGGKSVLDLPFDAIKTAGEAWQEVEKVGEKMGKALYHVIN